MTTEEYERRIADLLEANNRYLERALAAEGEFVSIREEMKIRSQGDVARSDESEIIAKNPGVFNFQ